MKKIIYLGLAVFISAFINGCGGSGQIVKVPNLENSGVERVKKLGEDKYMFVSTYSKSKKERINTFREVLNFAANYGLKHGYKYMAIVNEKNNNLSGFLFNDWHNFKKYAMLDPKISGGDFNPIVFGNSLDTVSAGNRVYLKVLYFKEAHPGLFLWDLKKLKRDTAQ
jgi:hypothetical protein